LSSPNKVGFKATFDIKFIILFYDGSSSKH